MSSGRTHTVPSSRIAGTDFRVRRQSVGAIDGSPRKRFHGLFGSSAMKARLLIALLAVAGNSLSANGQGKPERFDEEATLVKTCTYEKPSSRITLEIWRHRGQLWYGGPNSMSSIDATSENACRLLAAKFL